MRLPNFFVISFLMILSMVFVQNTFAQEAKEPIDIDLSETLSETLGFIMGQKFTLNRIKSEYSALSLQVKKVDLDFKHTFGIAEKNIKKILQGILKDKYSEYISEMKKQIESNLNSQQINKDTALKFLDEVESRARGKIPSPIIETLLNYQFEDRPADEFNRGFKETYRTKEHPKAKGLDLQIEFAKSWSLREGKRPNVIQFFSSNNGRGSVYAQIITRDLLKEAQGQLTSAEIKTLKTLEGIKELSSELFSESSLREMANGMGMTNVRNINTKRIVLDRWPGAMLEFNGDQQRLDHAMTIYNRVYLTIYKNYMIFFQCHVAKLPDETEGALKTRVSKITLLFDLMANSLVIQSQYNETPISNSQVYTKSTSNTDSVKSQADSVNWLNSLATLLVFTLLITWGIGLTPPLLIRFLIMRRPMGRWWAIGTAVMFFFIYLIISIILREKTPTTIWLVNKGHTGLLLIAWASYAILRKKAKT